MRFTNLICITATSLFAALAIPALVLAQENTPPNHARPHYKVIEIGTFGGPNSFFGSGAPIEESVNNRGLVVGGASTGLSDPYAPNCFFDCYIDHAFQWKEGFLSDLGTLPPGGFSSTASWVNEQGLIMGESETGFIDPSNGLPQQVAVVWLQNGEIVDLGTLGGDFSYGNAMNNRGEVAGIALNTVPDPFSYLGGTETHAFVWRNGYMEDLGTLGGPDSWGADVNERGDIVGWSYINSTPNSNNGPFCGANVPTQDPVLWRRDGEMIDLGTFGGTCGVVGSMFNAGSGGAINNRGQIVGTSNLAGNQSHHAFLWNEGALMDLGTLGGDNSDAYWINDAGEIVGAADVPGTEQNHHAFLWQNGKMTDLGTAKGWPCSTAIDINSKGRVIIDTGICFVGGGPGMLWENGTLYDLNKLIPPNSGIYISGVNFVNDRGEIGANGVLPNGDQRVLLLVPVSEDEGSTNSSDAASEAVPGRMNQPNRLMVPSSPRNSGRPSRLGSQTPTVP